MSSDNNEAITTHDVEAGTAEEVEAIPMEEVPLDDSNKQSKDGTKRVTIREKSFFGKQCHKIFKVSASRLVAMWVA